MGTSVVHSQLLPLPDDPSVLSQVFYETNTPDADERMMRSPLSRLVHELFDMDVRNPVSAPQFIYDGEYLPGPEIVRLRQPVRPIDRKKDVVIIGVEYKGGSVLKYQSNCMELDNGVTSLMRDFLFQLSVSGMNISPKVYYLAPPAKLPNFRTPKINFRMDVSEFLKCSSDSRSHVRYMLMERISKTAWDLIQEEGKSASVSFMDGIGIMRSLIPELRDKHQGFNIVHNDAHPGNIVLLKDGSYGFIDFGLSFHGAEFGPEETMMRRFKEFAHCYSSHYIMEGSRSSYRDDLYMVILSAVFVMTGLALYDLCFRLESNLEGMYTFHRNSNFFMYRDILSESFPEISKDERMSVLVPK